MSPDTVISIPFSSSSFHFSIKLNYTCKLSNCFPLYGISDKPLSKKETFCSNQTLSSSCITQQQLKHAFQKILYVLFFPPFGSLHKPEILARAAAVYYNLLKLQWSELTFLRTEILFTIFFVQAEISCILELHFSDSVSILGHNCQSQEKNKTIK